MELPPKKPTTAPMTVIASNTRFNQRQVPCIGPTM